MPVKGEVLITFAEYVCLIHLLNTLAEYVCWIRLLHTTLFRHAGKRILGYSDIDCNEKANELARKAILVQKQRGKIHLEYRINGEQERLFNIFPMKLPKNPGPSPLFAYTFNSIKRCKASSKAYYIRICEYNTAFIRLRWLYSAFRIYEPRSMILTSTHSN